MAQTYTEKGTAEAKAAGTILSIDGASLINGVVKAGNTIWVPIAWETNVQNDKPTLYWGKVANNKQFKYVVDSEEIRGDTTLRWYKKRIKKGKNRQVRAVWDNNVNARTFHVIETGEASAVDVRQGNTGASTTSPATGTAVTSLVANTLSLAAFAMLGPASDADPTAGAGHTLGQKSGRSSGGATSNITLVSTYEILTATGNIRSTLTLTTARAYAASIVAAKVRQTFTVGRAFYTPFDAYPEAEAVRFIMEDESGDAKFTIVIPRDEFDDLTDTEVTDYLARRCTWWTDKQLDDDPSPDFTPDAAFNTRVSGFVDDEIKV